MQRNDKSQITSVGAIRESPLPKIVTKTTKNCHFYPQFVGAIHELPLQISNWHTSCIRIPNAMRKIAINNMAFTMFELMATIALITLIIGIASVSYMSYVRQSKRSEIPMAFSAIKIGEESYFSENGMYISLPRNPATFIPGNLKKAFTYDSSVSGTWGTDGIAVKPDASVYFSYVLVSGKGSSVNEGYSAIDKSALYDTSEIKDGSTTITVTDSGAWYRLQAAGDLDADATAGTIDAKVAIFDTIQDSSAIYKKNEDE